MGEKTLKYASWSGTLYEVAVLISDSILRTSNVSGVKRDILWS